MTRNSSDAHSAAYDAQVVTGHDDRSDSQRAADERALAEDTVARLTTKRDKAAQHLDDAEKALAEAEADLEGGD